MDFFKVRVKFQEAFKDGNVLEGRLFKAGEVVEISEVDVNKVRQSGGLIDILERLIPNPLKVVVHEDTVTVAVDFAKPESVVIVEKPVETLPKRKAGRPKKHVA